MSFKVELVIEGNTYNVRRFYTWVVRNTDTKGRPSSMPSWGINLRIDAVDDTTLTSWMIDPTKQMEGKLIIYRIGQNSKLKEIKFKKAYCGFLRDQFFSEKGFSICEIVIKGEEIQFNTVSLKHHWPN
jgi:Hemolysin coregulated protein Hcp (TssD)